MSFFIHMTEMGQIYQLLCIADENALVQKQTILCFGVYHSGVSPVIASYMY